jgi:hypothetical protein
MRYPAREDLRLAGARPGNDKQGSLIPEGCLPLDIA